MALENNPGIFTWNLDPWDSGSFDSNPQKPSFEFVLDAACERLWEKKVEFSIRRINAMEEKLNQFEKELDEFLGKRAPGGELSLASARPAEYPGRHGASGRCDASGGCGHE